MQERGWIEPIVERVVGQVLESHAAQLRTEIVRRVMKEISAESKCEPSLEKTTPGSADLARAVSEIQLGASQREILCALLDTSARCAARVALFVVKGNHATGWQARGFANNDAVKDFLLDEKAPAVVNAVADQKAASVPVASLDSRFFAEVGAPASGEGRILPLILKDKVASLIYADSGTGAAGLLDSGSLELLVLSASAWLEVNSLRKQTHKEPSAPASGHNAHAVEAPAEPASVSPPAFNDPFAAHVPAFASHAKAAAAATGEGSAVVASAAADPAIGAPVHFEAPSVMVEMEPPVAAPPEWPAPLTAAAETAAAPQSPAFASLSPEDQDVHTKARRFARLLVDEIKLYNKDKVAEARRNKDLYNRLQEAIEKSQTTYQKRYGNSVAASANYFEREIIKSLAEDDPSLMGPNFPR